MSNAKQSMHPGSLVALILAGTFGLVAIYFLQAKFHLKEIKSESTTSQSTINKATDTTSSQNATSPLQDMSASTPELTQAAFRAVTNSSSSSVVRISAPLAAPALVTAKNGQLVRDTSLDLGGYYFSKTNVRVGKFKLEHIDFGSKDEFEIFEKRGQTRSTWTPFEFQFADMTSREIEGDLGPYYENSPRIFCLIYKITRNTISCHGEDKQVGKLIFLGKIDLDYATALSDPEGSTEFPDKIAMTGDLTINGKVFRNLKFNYWAGD